MFFYLVRIPVTLVVFLVKNYRSPNNWWWLRRDPPPHMIVKRFGCMAIHKALYKCIIHSFIQLLINLLYVIPKYWIQSFCQLVFFHLRLVLCFYLHLINRRPHLSESRPCVSESRHLIFWVKKSIFSEFSQYEIKKLWKFALFLTLVCFNV